MIQVLFFELERKFTFFQIFLFAFLWVYTILLLTFILSQFLVVIGRVIRLFRLGGMVEDQGAPKAGQLPKTKEQVARVRRKNPAAGRDRMRKDQGRFTQYPVLYVFCLVRMNFVLGYFCTKIFIRISIYSVSGKKLYRQKMSISLLKLLFS